MAPSARSPRGFTLIELLVATAISLLLLGMVIAGYRKFQENRALKMAVEEVKNTLRLVKLKAVHGEKPSGCQPLDGYQIDISGGILSWRVICNGIPGNGGSLQLEDVSITGSGFPTTFVALTGVIKDGGAASITLSYGENNQSISIDSSGLIY